VTPLDESDFDRLLIEAMRAAPEHPLIANLAARAMGRAESLEGKTPLGNVIRLVRYSLIHQVLAALSAAAAIALAAFTVGQLFFSGASSITEIALPAADSFNETWGILQVLDSEQMALTAIAMALVMSTLLVVHLTLSSEPHTAYSKRSTNALPRTN
jgi:hypothetical protein